MCGLKEKLGILVSLDKISEDQYKKLLRRGITYEKFGKNYPVLEKLFPEGIPIGASDAFIENLDFPYQETSYVCARAGPYSKTYLYKTNSENGGIINLTSGHRPVGDSLFAAFNRILLGEQAILISADNLIANSQQIWNWNFFAQNLKKYPDIYEELKKFAAPRLHTNPTQIILARKKDTFERLGFVEKYLEQKIKIFNSEKNSIIILTNEDGYQYASKTIKENDKVQYVCEVDENGNIDIKKCLKILRKNFNIKKLLNDGGRQMSNGIKEIGMLGGERISYEPCPDKKFLPKTITDDMILGVDGTGIDGTIIQDALVAFSQDLNFGRKELFNLHIYPM
jgi:hypothetical protein